MIVIYSKDNCIQCNQAAALLRAKGKMFETKKLDKDFTREDLTELCVSQGKPEPRSFPTIFKDGEYLGSLQDLKMAVAQGTL